MHADHVPMARPPMYSANTTQAFSTVKPPVIDPQSLNTEALHSPLWALMLDEVDYGMVLVNAQGGVIHLNHAARSEMDRSHPLQCTAGHHLTVRSAHDQRPLEQAIQAASRQHRRCLLTLGEECDELPLFVAVLPLPTRRGIDDEAAAIPRLTADTAVLLMFSKRRVCEPLSVQWFAQQHGLTLSETQVLCAMSRGASPDDVATSQGVAMSTIRSQISSIRGKTGTKNLRDLLRQIAMLPPLRSTLRVG